MPLVEPPTLPPGNPTTRVLLHRTVLWRMHSDAFDPTAFNPTQVTNPFAGGRFDSSDGSYSYLYAAENRDVAVAETLLREIPQEDFARARLIPLEGDSSPQGLVARAAA